MEGEGKLGAHTQGSKQTVGVVAHGVFNTETIII